MQRAPNYESPRCSVPQAAEQHRDHDIAINKPSRTAISAEWNVEIIAKPRRKADMPPVPEIRDVLRKVREAKIDR